jgi:DNA-binding SARP family transcriptional activator
MIGVGDFGPQLARRCATVREACSLVTSSLGAIVIFVGEEEATSDDFERLIAAIRRHAAAGVVAGGAQAEARLVLVSHGERCAVYLRPPRSSTAAVPQVTRRQAAGVEVAILGPVEVRGSAEPLGGHPLLTELVVYLAMHPEGVSTTAWETALWPERRMPQQTIANRLSEARRALGIASDGVPRLRRSDDRYLVAEVTTDYDRFKVLADDEDDPTAWLRALEIVRGRPFTDLHQGHWVALEGFALEVAHQVVDCALRFGRTSLRNQDPDAAMRAAQLALRAVPWDERLHRLLMVASDAAGDRAGVEATIRHLALVLEVDGDPLRAVHPETARLYARLSGRMDAPLGA